MKKTYQIYRKVKDQIEGNLFDYIICDILDDNQDKKAKTYTIVVKVEILERDLNALLIDENTDTGEANSSIVIVPFALEVTSAQSFDTRGIIEKIHLILKMHLKSKQQMEQKLFLILKSILLKQKQQVEVTQLKVT